MIDADFMAKALELAEAMAGRTGDNPSVGCVIVLGGEIVGEGVTSEGGRPHAEEQALTLAGDRARGATVYVTLEPCARRTSGAASCAELLRNAGVARVVIAASDPHPFASGAGLRLLEEAGVAVEGGVMQEQARALNAAFFLRWERPAT